MSAAAILTISSPEQEVWLRKGERIATQQDILADKDLPASAKNMAIALVLHCLHELRYHISPVELGAECGLERSVSYTNASELVKRGFVRIDEEGYMVIVPVSCRRHSLAVVPSLARPEPRTPSPEIRTARPEIRTPMDTGQGKARAQVSREQQTETIRKENRTATAVQQPPVVYPQTIDGLQTRFEGVIAEESQFLTKQEIHQALAAVVEYARKRAIKRLGGAIRSALRGRWKPEQQHRSEPPRRNLPANAGELRAVRPDECPRCSGVGGVVVLDPRTGLKRIAHCDHKI